MTVTVMFVDYAFHAMSSDDSLISAVGDNISENPDSDRPFLRGLCRESHIASKHMPFLLVRQFEARSNFPRIVGINSNHI
jgi:hypothetical protein